MSHSVPSDSSLLDPTFLIGIDLVRFDRRDLPIYAQPHSLWADAGGEPSPHGACVDCIYDDDGEIYVASLPLIEEPREIASPGYDPLVSLTGLGDGILLPGCERQPGSDLRMLETALPDAPPQPPLQLYDFSGGLHVLSPMPEGQGWDLAKPEWFYDHHI